jgi:hypothetical protein
MESMESMESLERASRAPRMGRSDWAAYDVCSKTRGPRGNEYRSIAPHTWPARDALAWEGTGRYEAAISTPR